MLTEYDFGHGSPARLPDDFKMEDFDGHMGFAADAQRFFDRRHLALAFAAHVTGVDATISSGNFDLESSIHKALAAFLSLLTMSVASLSAAISAL